MVEFLSQLGGKVNISHTIVVRFSLTLPFNSMFFYFLPFIKGGRQRWRIMQLLIDVSFFLLAITNAFQRWTTEMTNHMETTLGIFPIVLICTRNANSAILIWSFSAVDSQEPVWLVSFSVQETNFLSKRSPECFPGQSISHNCIEAGKNDHVADRMRWIKGRSARWSSTWKRWQFKEINEFVIAFSRKVWRLIHLYL